MANINLRQYGITGVKEILYNPTYEVLYNEETKPGLEGFDKGQVTELGAINVMTGVYTGRSPKDKYIVYDNTTKEGKPESGGPPRVIPTTTTRCPSPPGKR